MSFVSVSNASGIDLAGTGNNYHSEVETKTVSPETFDHITSLATLIFKVPFAFVSLVNNEGKWVNYSSHLEFSQTEDVGEFCKSTILSPQPLVVPDTSEDTRFASLPLVTGTTGIRFYAGIRLATSSGSIQGTLSLFDQSPRTFDESQLQHLKELAAIAVQIIETYTLPPATVKEPDLEINQNPSDEILNRNHELYRILARNIPNAAIYMFDQNYKYILAEGSILDRVQTRWSKQDVEGKTLWEVLPGPDGEKLAPLYQNALNGLTTLTEKSYGDRTYLVQTLPARLENGEIYAGIIISQDITRNKQMQDALQASEARYRELYLTSTRQAQELALLHKVRTTLSYHNDLPHLYRSLVEQTSQELGYPSVSLLLKQGDILKLNCEIGYPLDFTELPLNEGVSGRVARTGQACFIPDVTVEPDFVGRKTEPVSMISIPLFDQEEVIGVLNVQGSPTNKLTEADFHLLEMLGEYVSLAIHRSTLYTRVKEREEYLQAERDFALQVMRNMAQGLVVFKPDFTIEYANPAFANMGGFMLEELIGKTPFDLTLNVPFLKFAEMPWDKLQEESSNFEIELVRKDGSSFQAQIATEPIYRGGKLSGIVAVISDVTRQRMVEQQLRRNLAKEKDLVEMKNRLISSISHEFRTPLSVIISSTELLEYYSQRWSEEKKQEILGRITHSANKLTGLIEDFLVYSRAEEGKLKCTRARLNLSLLCADLVNSFQLNAGSDKTLRFTEIGERQEAFLDQKLIDYILNNLLSNAIKYTGPIGQVELILEWQPEQVVFQVIDNGIGIPYQEQASLFEPFQRGSNVGSIAGTGFGLVIVKQSVLAHQGQITIDSEEGLGTTFTVTLPLNNILIDDNPQKTAEEMNLLPPTGIDGLTEAEIVTHSQNPFMRSWLLEQAIEASNSGFVITFANKTQTDNSIIYASKGFEKLTGYLSEEVIGKTCRFLQGADNDQEGLDVLRRAIKEEQDCKVIVRNYRKDGSLFYNEIQLSPIRDQSGKVVYYIGIQNDVSERIKAEAALNQSEQKFKTLVENSPDIIARFDRNGRYLYANPTLVRISDGTLTADLVKGKTHSELGIPQQFLDGFENHIKLVFETGQSARFVVAPEIPDRYRQFYQALIVPEYSSDGKEVVSVLSIGRDITDLKKTNSALEASEKRLSTILHSITDAFITLNADWKFTYLNPRAEKLLQYGREKLIEHNIWEKFPEAVNTNFWKKCHIALDEMKAVSFEEYFNPLASWFDVYAYPSDDGGLSIYFHDISKRKVVEEKLKQSETRFRSLIEQGSDIFILLEADYRIKYVSPSAGRMLGYNAEELQGLIGQNWLEQLLPLERALIEDVMPDFLKKPGESMKYELQFLHKNGFRLYREVTFQNLVNLPGVEAIVINSRDIHERKLAEEALRKSEQEYRLLMEQAPVAIYICDEKEKILEVNEACCALTGYSREELLQMSLPDLVPRELQENKRTPTTLLDNNNIISRIRRLRRKDGSWTEVETNLRLMKDNRIVGIARNISDLSSQPQLKGLRID